MTSIDYRQLFTLDHNVVILTGAAGGIGRVLATALADFGTRLVLTDRDAGGLQKLSASLTGSGHAHVTHVADLTVESAALELADVAVRVWGRIDTLINNAAAFSGLSRGHIEDIGTAEWQTVLNTNLTAPWQCIKAVTPVMRAQQSGSIINVSSTTVFTGSSGWPHYVSSKMALIGLTRSLARDLGPSGIRINALAPGFTQTPSALAMSQRGPSAHAATRANRRHQYPSDLVGAAVFLASRASSFVTGQTIVVDGGVCFR